MRLSRLLKYGTRSVRLWESNGKREPPSPSPLMAALRAIDMGVQWGRTGDDLQSELEIERQRRWHHARIAEASSTLGRTRRRVQRLEPHGARQREKNWERTQRENDILVRKLRKISARRAPKARHHKLHKSSRTVQKEREALRIDDENRALFRRLQKSSSEYDRRSLAKERRQTQQLLKNMASRRQRRAPPRKSSGRGAVNLSPEAAADAAIEAAASEATAQLPSIFSAPNLRALDGRRSGRHREFQGGAYKVLAASAPRRRRARRQPLRHSDSLPAVRQRRPRNSSQGGVVLFPSAAASSLSSSATPVRLRQTRAGPGTSSRQIFQTAKTISGESLVVTVFEPAVSVLAKPGDGVRSLVFEAYDPATQLRHVVRAGVNEVRMLLGPAVSERLLLPEFRDELASALVSKLCFFPRDGKRVLFFSAAVGADSVSGGTEAPPHAAGVERRAELAKAGKVELDGGRSVVLRDAENFVPSFESPSRANQQYPRFRRRGPARDYPSVPVENETEDLWYRGADGCLESIGRSASVGFAIEAAELRTEVALDGGASLSATVRHGEGGTNAKLSVVFCGSAGGDGTECAQLIPDETLQLLVMDVVREGAWTSDSVERLSTSISFALEQQDRPQRSTPPNGF